MDRRLPRRSAAGIGRPAALGRRWRALAFTLGCAAALTGAHAQTEDVLVFSVTQALQHDSNLLRLPSWASPSAVTGGAASSRSDLISTTSLGVRFDREASLQRLRADATLNVVRYRDYSYLDYEGYNAGAAWDWAAGRHWYGAASARTQRYLASFTEVSNGSRNVVDLQQYRLQGGFRFTPAWSAVGAVDGLVRDNSGAGWAQNDWRASSVEAGARWEPRSGADWRFLWRRTDGRYPNRQVTDAIGNPLPVTVDNAYTEDRVFTRMGIEPGGSTRLEGEIGFTRRRFDNLGQRDFSGLTWDLTYLWRPTGALSAVLYARRNLGGTELLTANYVDSHSIGGGPAWQITDKTSLRASAERRRLNYDGDPGFAVGSEARRADVMNTLSGTLTWEPMRKVTLSAQLHWLRRHSNYDWYDFKAFGGGVTGQVRF